MREHPNTASEAVQAVSLVTVIALLIVLYCLAPGWVG